MACCLEGIRAGDGRFAADHPIAHPGHVPRRAQLCKNNTRDAKESGPQNLLVGAAVTSHNVNALTAATFGVPVGEGLRWVVVHCQSLTSFGPVGSGPGDH